MSRHYTPKKHKIHAPSIVGAMKKVRVDHRTEIMVSVDISDADAIERYLARINASKPSIGGYKLAKKVDEPDANDVPQEELAAVVDDTELPEEE